MIKKSILHVVEAGGGGVLTALNRWVNGSSEYTHTIFMAKRLESYSDLHWGKNVNWVPSPNGIIPMLKYYRKLIKSGEFDVIHFHSTKAGLFRIFKAKSIIVYSPHCFAFERTGKNSILNFGIYLIEKVLSTFTDFFAVVSEREKLLAKKLNPNSGVELISFNVSEWKSSKAKDKIVVIGRICYQKNPREIAEIIYRLSTSHHGYDYVWIGDGDKKYKSYLLDAGVRITGWIKPKEVTEELKDAAFMLHAARWEGMPMVFAEALAGGVPIVARNSKYLHGESKLESIHVYKDKNEAIKLCEEILYSKEREYSKDFEINRILYSNFLNDIFKRMANQ